MGLVSNQNAPANNGNGSRTAAATPGPPLPLLCTPLLLTPLSPLLPSLRWCCCCTQPQSIRGAGASAGIVMKKAQGWACARGVWGEEEGNRGCCFAGLLLLALCAAAALRCCHCCFCCSCTCDALYFCHIFYPAQIYLRLQFQFPSNGCQYTPPPPSPTPSVLTACCICYCCGCKFG